MVDDAIKFVSDKSSSIEPFDKLQNKPFWIWNIEEHKLEDIRTKRECCFNHIIGLPTKEGLEKPIFDYQELLYEALLSPDFCNPLNHDFKDKHLWIKKATGLGVTEFFLSGSYQRNPSKSNKNIVVKTLIKVLVNHNNKNQNGKSSTIITSPEKIMTKTNGRKFASLPWPATRSLVISKRR